MKRPICRYCGSRRFELRRVHDSALCICKDCFRPTIIKINGVKIGGVK
jgi:ribosomal protein S14